ncbi:MAG: hypothetical protein EP343_32870 [Deltaproteobacteria bacterium]|nr:MAG: hypothetical protein EP343_32870 [Deltaproteobacteria bacterium]
MSINRGTQENPDVQDLDVPDNQTLQELYEQHKDLLLSLKKDAIQTPRVTRERSLALTRTTRSNFADLLPSLEDWLAPKKMDELKDAYSKLDDYSFVLFFASLFAQQDWTAAQKERRQELMLKVREHDSRYMAWSRALFFDDSSQQAELDRIQSGRGSKDDATDTIELVSMLLKDSRVTQPNDFLEEAKLREAEAEARELLWLLSGAKEENAPKGSPVNVWHRAYTLWATTYDSLMRGGRSVLNMMGYSPAEQAKQFPGISSESSGSSPASQDPASTEPAARVENFG